MTYVVKSKVSDEIVTLPEAKNYLNVCFKDNDNIIQSLIRSVVISSEILMNRNLLTTTWENYRDSFYEDLTLRRGEFQSVESIESLVNDVYTTLPTTEYTVSIGGSFGEICEINPPSSVSECNLVRITFKTGFGDSKSNIPEDIKLAIKSQIAFLYNNRGDCGCDSKSMSTISEQIFKQYKIIDIAGEGTLDCL